MVQTKKFDSQGLIRVTINITPTMEFNTLQALVTVKRTGQCLLNQFNIIGDTT